MPKKTWSKTLQQLTRNLEDTWDDLVHDDTSQIEREFNRLVGRLQRRHGYSPDHAIEELQNQWNTYSKRTKALVEKQLESLPGRKKKRQTRWPWLTLAIIGGLYGAFKLFRSFSAQSSAQSTVHNAAPGKSNAASRPQNANSVDERSLESFPASDPPATW